MYVFRATQHIILGGNKTKIIELIFIFWHFGPLIFEPMVIFWRYHQYIILGLQFRGSGTACLRSMTEERRGFEKGPNLREVTYECSLKQYFLQNPVEIGSQFELKNDPLNSIFFNVVLGLANSLSLRRHQVWTYHYTSRSKVRCLKNKFIFSLSCYSWKLNRQNASLFMSPVSPVFHTEVTVILD